ncbi:MAG: acyl-CoA dehydrogenase [Acidobacteria bacterium]|nr:acyl-CoA dehydrogenase [Acidobacteriota bacterium]
MFGMTTPQQYGGLGLGMSEEVRVVFELAYASPVFRAALGSNNGIGALGLINEGTPEQKQKYLPRIATGELIASFCLTEANAGSDVAALETSAVRDGDSYILNGTKRFITNSPRAGLYTVYARTAPKEAGTAGISALLVERTSPGLSVAEPWKTMGFRGSHSADVIFEDCRVPADALLGGKEGVGFKAAMRTLDHARIHMAALAQGMSRRLIDEGLAYVQKRRQFGQAIANFQLIQAMLADCETETVAGRAMIEKVARDKDAGENITKDAACAKYFSTEALGRIADRVLQMHGGIGYTKTCAVERLYRDARLLRIFEGTSQIQQIVIAREMLRGTTVRE